MITRSIPVYTEGQVYASGTVVRYGYNLYVCKGDIQSAPIEFNEDDWASIIEKEEEDGDEEEDPPKP